MFCPILGVFVSNALKNGWLVSDITAIQSCYKAIQAAPDSAYKTQADFILRQFAELEAVTLLDRFETLRRLTTPLYNIWSGSDKKSELSKTLRAGYTSTSALLGRNVFPAEYPNDLDFAKTAGSELLENGVNYYQISNDTGRFANYLSVAEEGRRTNQNYYIPEIEDALQAESREHFNAGMLHSFFGGINKKPSAVVREAFGEAVYDDIYEMNRGSAKDRTVRLHHSQGTKYQKAGYDVLEMDFAGSGGQDVSRAHKGRRGRIKREIEELRRLKQQSASGQELLQQNKNLIEACRTYMKGVSMPPKGRNAELMGLVGDTLSFTMRENNQLKKELNLVKVGDPQAILDAKIKAHKDRLEKKEGYLERKQALAEKRLGQEERVLDMMKNAKGKCETWLKKLDQTKSWKSNSSSYNKMHKMLEEGTKLSPRTTLNQMTDFLNRFTKASGSYFESHNTLIGPISGDGSTRLTESMAMQTFGKAQLQQLKQLSSGMGERNTPIGLRIMKHNDELDELERRRQERSAAPANPEIRKAVKPGVQQQEAAPTLPSL